MNYSSSSSSGAAATAGGPIAAIGGFALIINAVGLFAFTGVALCVFGYIALTLWMVARARRSSADNHGAEGGEAFMVLSWLAALIAGAAVGAFHWVAYAHAAYVVLGLYALAVVIWLLQRAFSVLWSVLFSTVGAAMLAMVICWQAPPGSDDMEKSENWTPVVVIAVDSAGKPIAGATVYLDLLQFWQGEPELDGDREWWSKRTTDNDGMARLDLEKDPRFKRLLIRVRHEPFGGGYNEPTTVGDYVGHEDARLTTSLPVAKTPYAFQVVMSERPHADSAFLAFELESPASAKDIGARSIKVALTTSPELPWHEDHHTFNDYPILKSGGLREVFLKDSHKLVIKLSNELADRPLTLHILERDYARNEDAYLELKTVRIDSIPRGDERVLPPLHVPDQKLAARPGSRFD